MQGWGPPRCGRALRPRPLWEEKNMPCRARAIHARLFRLRLIQPLLFPSFVGRSTTAPAVYMVVQSEGLLNGGLPSERLLPPEGGRWESPGPTLCIWDQGYIVKNKPSQSLNNEINSPHLSKCIPERLRPLECVLSSCNFVRYWFSRGRIFFLP